MRPLPVVKPSLRPRLSQLSIQYFDAVIAQPMTKVVVVVAAGLPICTIYLPTVRTWVPAGGVQRLMIGVRAGTSAAVSRKAQALDA